jgi:transcription initiation factor TFIIF subunit beta
MEDIRKDRLPREEMIEIIFKCFETHPYWSLKGMVEHTKQPTVCIASYLSLAK